MNPHSPPVNAGPASTGSAAIGSATVGSANTSPTGRVVWRRRLRTGFLALAVLLALYGLIAVFALPAAVRWAIEGPVSEQLGRAVTVEDIGANPYALRVTLRGVIVHAGAQPSTATPLARVREVVVDASVESIARLAPVIDRLTVDGLEVDLVRLAPQRFNASDIVERLQAGPREPGPGRGFALSNLRLTDSRIQLDDRVLGERHELSGIEVGIPFLSSLPVHSRVEVQPFVRARLDGTPIELKGETRPFHRGIESSLALTLAGLDLPRYLAYSPVPLAFTVPRGQLDTALHLRFRMAVPATAEEPAQAAAFLIDGTVAVRDFALHDAAPPSRPLAQWNRLDLDLAAVEPLARRAQVRRLRVEAPHVWAQRELDGRLNWMIWLGRQVEAFRQSARGQDHARPQTAPTPPPAAGATNEAKDPALAVEVAAIEVRGGKLDYLDLATGMDTLALEAIEVDVQRLSTTAAEPARIKFSARGPHGQTLGAEGGVRLTPLVANVALTASELRLDALNRHLIKRVRASVDGRVDVAARLELDRTATPPRLALHEVALELKDLRVTGLKGSNAQLRIPAVRLAGGEIDTVARSASLVSLTVEAPQASVERLPSGAIDWLQLVLAPDEVVPVARHPAAPAAPEAAPETTRAPSGGADDQAATPPWRWRVSTATIHNGRLRLADRTMEPASRFDVQAIELSVQDLTGNGREPARVRFGARVGAGRLTAAGTAAWQPLAVRMNVDARALDLAPAQPYLARSFNAVLASAGLSARGRVTLMQERADQPWTAAYNGQLRVTDFNLKDGSARQDLLRWDTFEIDRVSAQVGGGAPTIELGTVALRDFYARVIVSEQGRLNLLELRRPPGSDATPPPGAPAAPATVAAADPARVPATVDGDTARPAAPETTGGARVAAPAADPPAALRASIRIGRIEIERGNVNFTDNLIRPNYTANLTGLGGFVTALASDSTTPATLHFEGKVDNEAPLRIDGQVNPLAPRLFLAIEGSTAGLDLPRFNPYATKYAGYPVTKGKLSMDVRYRIEDGKLDANNHLFIDQLTLGEKVDSPTATKLPVPLGVALLKNLRGEIDLNLPVTGSLDDPEFSFGGIVWQVIGNVLTKVIAAPFTLLTAAFGDGEELGYVAFAPGSAALPADQESRLDKLARALADRPALKVDIIGRVDPAVDTDALRAARLEEKLRAAWGKPAGAAASTTGTAKSPDAAPVIPATERPALLAAVYSEEKIPDKPRNFIGMARSLPAPEMEKLLLAYLAPTPQDLRALAAARATAVRDRLEAQGKVDRGRLFLVEPRLTTEGIADQGVTTRVDFALK